ncbi:carbon-nitrogen family hydrolase [Geovibrio sp. ADMFC3]
MRILSLQFPMRLGDIESNKEKFLAVLSEVIDEQPSIIILPEMWATGFDYQNLNGFSRQTEEICNIISERLNENTLVISTLPEGNYNKVYNTVYAVSAKGVIASYRKNFLFTPLNEHVYIDNGKGITLFEFMDVKVGLLLCYEIRFPELFRMTARAGAELIAVPAVWGAMKKEHWLTLLRARAIENQCYIAGCNTSVMHGRKDMPCGYSVMYDPWGEAVYEPSAEEGVYTGFMESAKVAEIREKIPSFDDALNAFVIERKN